MPFDLGSVPGPGSNSFPTHDSNLYVSFDFAAYTAISLDDLPQTQHQFNLADSESWTIGRHNIKAGIDWRTLRTNLYTLNPIEEVAFDNESEVIDNSPGFGYVVTSGRTTDNEPVYKYFSSFLQDEWKVTPGLSISSGLRWDISPSPANANGSVPLTVTEVNDLTTTFLAPRGTPLWKTDWLGFAPRVGAAFQTNPGSQHDTVVRAGV